MSIPKLYIEKLKSGDSDAFREIYTAYAPFVFDIAVKVLKDKVIAEEIVQDTFVKLWQYRTQLDESKDIKPLLYVSAKRLCLNQIRKFKIANIFLDQLSINPSNEVEENYNRSELEKLLQQPLASMSSQQRRAFELSRNEGFTYQQIADKMGISPNTVRNHIAQALHHIRKFLSSVDYQIILILFFFFL